MSIGILGKKIGMTRVYDDKGAAVAVTVIAAEPNVVTLVRTLEKDGYRAVQLAFDETTEKRSTKPMNGHFKKAGVAPRKRLQEFPLAGDEQLAVGAAVDVSQFTPGQFVDIIGVTKGKGFQGVVRRFRFGGQPASHGSMMHRRIGAIGQRTTPGRVYKNFRMPGHMGSTSVTVQNLRVVQVRPDDHVLLIKGAVPGAKGSYVVVRQAVKKTNAKEAKTS